MPLIVRRRSAVIVSGIEWKEVNSYIQRPMRPRTFCCRPNAWTRAMATSGTGRPIRPRRRETAPEEGVLDCYRTETGGLWDMQGTGTQKTNHGVRGMPIGTQQQYIMRTGVGLLGIHGHALRSLLRGGGGGKEGLSTNTVHDRRPAAL